MKIPGPWNLPTDLLSIHKNLQHISKDSQHLFKSTRAFQGTSTPTQEPWS